MDQLFAINEPHSSGCRKGRCHIDPESSCVFCLATRTPRVAARFFHRFNGDLVDLFVRNKQMDVTLQLVALAVIDAEAREQHLAGREISCRVRRTLQQAHYG